MAKELPYFKFFVSEWNDGDITLEDYETQGLFINLCAYYWSNECEITLTKAMKKFARFSGENSFNYLIDNDIIKVENDVIIINFLDEQKDERLESSKRKSKGGKASAEARRLKKLTESQQSTNTSSTESQQVLNSCSTEVQVLREEKRREEEIREEVKEDGSTPTQKVLLFDESKHIPELVAGYKKFIQFIDETTEVKNIPSQITIESYQKLCDEHERDKLWQKITELDNWLTDPNVPKGKKKKKSLTHLMQNTWLKNGY
tara:strand:- start:293 stop:1072 length:780 start_codon:yes stop_codon:yes gene_type:complete